MKILGISAYYHDSAAALIVDGVILSAAQEERFTRKKHDPSFPSSAIRFCLDSNRLKLSELDAVVFYDKPWLKFERLLETYYVYAPTGVKSFIASMPVWIKDKLFLRSLILKELEKIEPSSDREPKLLFSEHHLSHAASAYYPSPFNEAAILTIDGVGEWATASIAHGKGKDISIIKEMRFPHSVGLLYSAFTYYLGFRVNSGEYKLMGLAPYGDPSSESVNKYSELILNNIADVKSDGSVFLNQEYFDYATGLRMARDDRWEKLFGFARRVQDTAIEQPHCDLALAIQRITDDIVLKLARTARDLTGSKNIVLAGGVALNCVSNSRLLDSKEFDGVWIQPAAGDAGGALGAAYAAHHIYYGTERNAARGEDLMRGSYLGPQFNTTEIERAVKGFKASFRRYDSFDALCGDISLFISKGAVVGWFQGRMEWGPRALGNRSILGDARNGEMQKRMNLKIKFRESFRPFAPSVLYEDAKDYFEGSAASPYMLFVSDIKKELRSALPAGYNTLPLNEKLYYKRSSLPAVTHLDFSARLQTVDKASNPRYWELINSFKQQTGCPVLVNTSFNVRGEPIVCTPEDAYRCFMRTDIDYLVMGDCVFSKKDQPEWRDEPGCKADRILD